MRAVAAIVLLGAALALPGIARADAEQDLAERYAPVVRLVEQEEECGPGEPYEPIDIDAVLDEDTVSLRGPWRSNDLVDDRALRGRSRPRALRVQPRLPRATRSGPGCDYERWARRITADTEPTVYAHVATEPAYPDRLSLQYWLYYPFNDWNNLHEGDWEMIQLVFPAASAEEALETEPLEVGYSQHEGAERAEWGDEKLEIVDGTHPVVYPAAGSHANFYARAFTWDARPSREWAATTRPARTRSSGRRCSRSRAIRRRPRGLSLDRVRGPLGRAPAGVLQRPHRAEPEDAVDGADHLGRGLARP